MFYLSRFAYAVLLVFLLASNVDAADVRGAADLRRLTMYDGTWALP